MYCKKCGTMLDENNVCPNCLTQVTEGEAPKQETLENNAPPAVNKYSGKSIAGFVVSLVGILVAAIPCGIVGVTLSALGMKEIDTYSYKGKGLAISGLVISIVDIVLGLIYLCL